MKLSEIEKTIGNTPMIKLHQSGSSCLYAKLEFFNPGGSVKDRIAMNMLQAAEKEDYINENTVIVEPTSGNTGIGLALVSASKGYKLKLVMPDSMSTERRNLLSGLGAELELTPGNEGMQGAVNRCQEILKQDSNTFMPQQFDNPANPEIHYHTTGEEVINYLQDEAPDYFVSGVGTGGTLTGVGKKLKEKFPHIQNIAVEPKKSPVLSGGQPAPHKIQGIGAGFIPKVLDWKIVDDVVTVTDEDAMMGTRTLMKYQGLLTGISSGAAYFVAKDIMSKSPTAKVVTILPDTGERYLSTSLFQEGPV